MGAEEKKEGSWTLAERMLLVFSCLLVWLLASMLHFNGELHSFILMVLGALLRTPVVNSFDKACTLVRRL